MKRRPSPPGPAVSLFPFLTVLISTMGALIVMLVMAVNVAERDSQALHGEQQRQIQERLDEIAAQRDLHQVRLAGWLAQRDELLAQRESLVTRNLQVELQLDEAQRRKRELAALLAQIESESLPPHATEIDQRLETLRREAERLEKELEQHRQRMQQPAPQRLYSVVPHTGPNGTARPPIYIECRHRKIVIQPYGIELAETDFPYDLQLGNPLEAALNTIRRYYRDIPDAGTGLRPYPLLIVRPDGSSSYALARRAMAKWDDEFGYELIDQSLDLDFGTAQPELTERVVSAVQAAKLDALARNLNRPQVQYDVLPSRATPATRTARETALEVDTVNGGFKRVGPGASRSAVNYVSHRAAGPRDCERISDPQRDAASVAGSTATDPRDALSSRFNSRGQPPAAAPGDARAASTNAAPTGAADPDLTGQESPSASTTPTSVPCLADRQGENWAIPQAQGKAIGMVRPVRISCHADRLVIWSEHGTTDEAQSIALANRATAEAIPELLSRIHKKIDAWGPALPGGYWKPELKIHINPGGDARARDLEQLLSRSGIEVSTYQP